MRHKQTKDKGPVWVDAFAISELFGVRYQTVAHHRGIFNDIPRMNTSTGKRATWRYHYPTALEMSQRFLDEWLRSRREEKAALMRARIAMGK